VTVTIQIGNSDDKLNQADWSEFWYEADALIHGWAEATHFTGFAASNAVWQNAAWVCEVRPDNVDRMKSALHVLAHQFKQDSIAWTEGETQFV
jgi:hypothetical protein